jgi:hypothetical protein
MKESPNTRQIFGGIALLLLLLGMATTFGRQCAEGLYSFKQQHTFLTHYLPIGGDDGLPLVWSNRQLAPLLSTALAKELGVTHNGGQMSVQSFKKLAEIVGFWNGTWFLVAAGLLIVTTRHLFTVLLFFVGVMGCLGIGMCHFDKLGAIFHYQAYSWDMMQAACFAACLMFYVRRVYWACAVVAAFAVGVKESAVIWSVALLFAPGLKYRERIMFSVISFLGGVGVKALCGVLSGRGLWLLSAQMRGLDCSLLCLTNAKKLWLFPFTTGALAIAGLLIGFQKWIGLSIATLAFLVMNYIYGVYYESRIFIEIMPICAFLATNLLPSSKSDTCGDRNKLPTNADKDLVRPRGSEHG